MRQPFRLAGLIVVMISSASAGADEPTPARVLADFQKSWKPAREYMRPLDDEGWKGRMEAFQKLASAGEKARPVLVEALQKGDDETRVFAAQALALLPDPASKDSLRAALKDKHPAVRLYAFDALSMAGKLPAGELYTALRQKDPNGDVRAHAGFALERDDKPRPEAIRQALRDYDLKQVATAKLGDKAPDFTLATATGKDVRLSDFRGKKPVVLVFVYGDT